MPWSELDDATFDDERWWVMGADIQPDAIAAHMTAWVYCASAKSDGRIPKGKTVGLTLMSPQRLAAAIAALMKADPPLWTDQGSHYYITNYLDRPSNSREVIEANRKRKADNQAAYEARKRERIEKGEAVRRSAQNGTKPTAPPDHTSDRSDGRSATRSLTMSNPTLPDPKGGAGSGARPTALAPPSTPLRDDAPPLALEDQSQNHRRAQTLANPTPTAPPGRYGDIEKIGVTETADGDLILATWHLTAEADYFIELSEFEDEDEVSTQIVARWGSVEITDDEVSFMESVCRDLGSVFGGTYFDFHRDGGIGALGHCFPDCDVRQAETLIDQHLGLLGDDDDGGSGDAS